MDPVLWREFDGRKQFVIREILDLDEAEIDIAFEDLSEGSASEFSPIRQSDNAAASRLITNVAGGEDQSF